MTRTAWAALLLVAALAALLVAWFLSGWADVRAQRRELEAAPARAAVERAAALAGELRVELGQLLARELERPYFHYQNLMHDPRSGGTANVAPSPLASGPTEPLVRGYFQLEAGGQVTTPPINDELPELSDQKRLADHQRFREEVAQTLRSLQPAGDPPVVAATEQRPAGQAPPQQSRAQQQAQVIELDESAYAQNFMPADTYRQQNAMVPARKGEVKGRAAKPIAITIAPLEWRTLPFAGAPALLAMRHVETPDRNLTQGFLIDPGALTAWLGSHGGDAQVALAARAVGASGAEVAPGWYLDVAASPGAIARAAGEAAAVATAFLLRFVIVGVIALLSAAFVVVLVARAERLARERSQFAAAAAHELRTPLAGLQLYGDMLADGLGDPSKLHDYARRMSEEASRLGRVVSNVLGFSQLERGNLSVDARPADLAAALRELAERAQPALDRAGAALDLDVPPDLSARFDRDALARIVGNLLDNAEKYSRDAEDRTIGIAAREAGDRVEVVVSDRGPGVAQAARGKLFRAFSRGVTADGPAGLGLGLALSQSLARAMGGDLEYRVAPAGGAMFVLRLAR